MDTVGAAADPGWPADALEVGRIIDAWGIKGWIKVQPFAADAKALSTSRRWFVRPPDDAVVGPGAARYPSSLTITQARPHGGNLVVALVEGVDNRTAAEALRGARLFVARSSFPATGDDEYYWVDLIGLDVHNRQGEHLGSVVGLIDTGPHSVLRVRPPAADSAPSSERLIPFVAAYVDTVDLERRLIGVDWGLDF